MKKNKLIMLVAIFTAFGMMMASCSKDDDEPTTGTTDPGESTTELLVESFSAAPVLDGTIDAMWSNAKRLVGTAEVPSNLGPRMTYFNSDGAGTEEGLDLFEGYEGEKYNFTLRSGYFGDDIYFLMEWDDAEDSKDRESWYFDSGDMKWKQQHKYANASDDKFYEDKFAFFFPIGTVDGFDASTCYAACHTHSTIENDKDKHTRHYLKGVDQKIDMWHWKRVRSNEGQVDDQRTTYKEGPYTSSTNGRSGDENGSSGYSNNKQTLNNGTDDVSVPMYVIPDQTDYYWISQSDVDNGTAKMVTAVDGNGVLTLDDNTMIDPAGGGYEVGTGAKRLPSVITKAFSGARADISVRAEYTGSGWVCEFSRKLNTGDVDDVVFDPANEYAFGLAIFNNAAIAHGVKPNLKMMFE